MKTKTKISFSVPYVICIIFLFQCVRLCVLYTVGTGELRLSLCSQEDVYSTQNGRSLARGLEGFA